MRYIKNTIVFLAIVILAVVVSSCQKTADNKKVDYIVRGFTNPYSIVYLNKDGNSISEKITPSGIEEEWVYSMEAKEGTPVYLYVKFISTPDVALDIISDRNFNAGIIVNGKYEYQRQGIDKVTDDTIYELKVSGIVPFN